jgi:hypothetical protein
VVAVCTDAKACWAGGCFCTMMAVTQQNMHAAPFGIILVSLFRHVSAHVTAVLQAALLCELG